MNWGHALGVVLLLAGPSSSGGTPDQSRVRPRESKTMPESPEAPRPAKLREAIVAANYLEAERLAKELGEESTPVLLEFEKSPTIKVRKMIVGLASMAGGAGACRLILRMLADRESQVRELAAAFVPQCNAPAILPQLNEALGVTHEPLARGRLARAVGEAGTSASIPLLRRARKDADTAELVRDIDAALARLGDEEALDRLVAKLQEGDSNTHVEALADCVYIGRAELARNFGPALKDRTDVTVLSIPKDPPMKYARVADIAVFTMHQLGIVMPFPVELLDRLSDSQLDEAYRLVARSGEVE